MGKRILVVEDEADLAYLITRNLEVEGYRVERVRDGVAAIDAVHRRAPDLMLLDLMLPRRSGLDVLRDIREAGVDVPVIILTARSAVSDRVLGLKLGADDYLTKPFEFAELFARITAVMRRVEGDDMPATLDIGDLHVDFVRLEAHRAGRDAGLSTREFRLLRALARYRGRALSRQRLLREAWGDDDVVTQRTVDTHVKNLRKKIEPDPSHPIYVRTLHGEGYMLVDDPVRER
ncbi:MAG: response regulator transcription factor [Phycisphaerae bacterium]